MRRRTTSSDTHDGRLSPCLGPDRRKDSGFEQWLFGKIRVKTVLPDCSLQFHSTQDWWLRPAGQTLLMSHQLWILL